MKTLLVVLLATVTASFAQERVLIDTVTGEIKQVQRLKKTKPANPQKWLTLKQAVKPVYNAETEKLVRTNVVTSTNLTINFVKVRLTSAEVDARNAKEAARIAGEAERAARNVKRQRLKNAVATLRQWKVDADATTVTSGNAVATLQQLVNRFGKLSEHMADLLEAERVGE